MNLVNKNVLIIGTGISGFAVRGRGKRFSL